MMKKAKMELKLGKGKYAKDVYPLLVNLAVRSRRNFAITELEDVVSEGIVEALGEIKKFDPKHTASVSTFLYRRVHGAMVDYMKAESGAREAWETGDAAQEAIKQVASVNNLEEDHSNRKLFLEAISLIENQLSDREATVVVRSYLEGRTDEQIGAEIGCTKREVRNIRMKGLGQLRQLFSVRGRNDSWVR